MSVWPVLVAGGAAMLLSAALVPLCGRVARRIDLVAQPGADRWRDVPVPLLGGLAIFAAVTITTLLVVPTSNTRVGVLLAGGAAMFAIGLLDDFRPLSPAAKLAAQSAVATAVIGAGLQLRLTDQPVVNIVITYVWIVGIVNAMNLLDNMDGLAAGIAIIAGSFRTALFVMDGNAAEAQMAAIFVGAIAGFLLYNWHPASIFMGDAGSLFVGFLLAGLSLVGDWPYSRGIASVLVVPVLFLLVPILETVWVTVTRGLRGQSILEGGRDHVSHHLVVLGLSERVAVGSVYLFAIVAGSLGLLSYRFGLSRVVVLVGFLAFGIVVFGVRLATLRPAGVVRGEAPLREDVSE